MRLLPGYGLNADSMLPLDQEQSLDSDIVSSADLRFPTIPVAGTPAGWYSLSQLITTKMALQNDADSSCDEASSSLGDSTYDFIEDRSTTTDDEEGDRMTASTSSDSFEADRPVVVASRQHTQPMTQVNPTNDADLDDSPLSVKTPTYSISEHSTFHPPKVTAKKESLAEDPDKAIEFEEPSVMNLNTFRFTEVSHTLRVIEGSHQVTGELQNSIKGLPPGKIHVTVRQTMTSQSIELKGEPYKVLFAGDSSMKEPVIKKIAAALAANMCSSTPASDDARPAKFNIVPVSAFGDSGHPDVVLIDSSGLELGVDECLAAGYSRCQDGKDILSLRMADGSHVQSWWIGSKYVLSNDWKLPDLAIFCASDDESHLSMQNRGLARSFMNRHNVPSIVIEKQATWGRHMVGAALTTLDYLTPHLCLESQHPNGYSPLSKKRYPIDLATFLNIDAGQLNRNLACLATSKRLSGPQVGTMTKHSMLGENFWYAGALKAFQRMSTCVSQKRVATILPLLAFVLLSVTPLMFWGLLGFPVSSTKSGLRPVDTFTTSITSSSMTIATQQPSLLSSSTPVASSAAPLSSQVQSPKSSSGTTDIAALLLDAYDLGHLRPNKSDEFMVQVLGDCHIVVNTPRWFRRTKKAPTLQLKVSRQNNTVEHTFSTIGEGVYALQIPHEEAYGMLNVSMIMHSKTTEQMNFEVNFGSSWLKVAAWKRATRAVSEAIQKDISIIQTGLSVVYNQSMTELSTIVRQTKDTVALQRKGEHAIWVPHLKWGAHSRDLVLAQTKDLSRNLSHRLHIGQKQVAQQIQSVGQSITGSISLYTHNSMQAVSPSARNLARSIKHFKEEGRGHAGEYLKRAQIKALRAWWEVVGVPREQREFACEGEF